MKKSFEADLDFLDRIHVNYIYLLKLLENPDKDWQKTYDELMQSTLF